MRRSSGASILVAAWIRENILSAAAISTKNIYAVRWDNPTSQPEGPDGLPVTVSFICTGGGGGRRWRNDDGGGDGDNESVENVKEAVAAANGLESGARGVSHLAHVEPNLRFLRPLQTAADVAALPDNAWVLWSGSSSNFASEGDDEGGGYVDSEYNFPAILPAQPVLPPARTRTAKAEAGVAR